MRRLNPTGGPVRPRQNYTYATRIPREPAVLPTPSPATHTEALTSAALSVSVPASCRMGREGAQPPQRPAASGLVGAQIHRAGVRRLDRGHERRADAVPLQLPDR